MATTVTTKDRIGYSFAESVRQQAIGIVALIEAGKLEQASLAALALTTQAAKVKQELSDDHEKDLDPADR